MWLNSVGEEDGRENGLASRAWSAAAALDPFSFGNRLRVDLEPAHARSRRRAEGPGAACSDGARNAASSLSSQAMTRATEAGAVIMPPLPALYAKPASIDEMIRHSVERALDLFGIDAGIVNWWGEYTPPAVDARRNTAQAGQ